MKEKKDWIYKTTAKKKYGLTDNQIEVAAGLGLIKVKEVRNPYYSSQTSLLVSVEDLEKNLEKIRELPRYSEEEKERRKYYQRRKKLRDLLEVVCPICKQRVRARRDSVMFEKAFNGSVNLEKAKFVLLLSHVRHEHTSYEQDLRELE